MEKVKQPLHWDYPFVHWGLNKKYSFAQFVKGKHYSEISALRNHPNIAIKQYGLRCFIKKKTNFRGSISCTKRIKRSGANFKTRYA